MPHVLLADDNPELCQLLEIRLKTLGATITVAHDATHALYLMSRNPPDLVILDIWMPAGNGLAVCEMMRDHAALCDVPILVITGDSSDEARQRVTDLGAHIICKGEDLWDRICFFYVNHFKLQAQPKPGRRAG